MTKLRSRAIPALSALISTAFAQVQAAHAGCAPAATAGNDIIVCTASTTTPVDAGAGNDTVTNSGSIAASQSASQSVAPPLPDFREFGSGSVDYAVGASSTAISGGAGDDTINNTGSVTSSADATLQTITAPVTLSGGQTVSATNTISAAATGIAGNDGAGSITSGGLIQTDATAKLTNVNVEHNFADTTRGNISTTVSALSTGIAAADGTGWSVANQNQVIANATASSGNTNVEANIVDAAVADVSMTVVAEADAVKAGLGAGTITNAGNLTVHAQAESADVSVNMSYLDITLDDPKPAQGGTTVTASGAGINGSESIGNLGMTNAAMIDVQTEAVGNALAISLASEGTPQGLKPLVSGILDEKGIASIGVTTNSNASGMLGGSGADTLGNTNAVHVLASSDARQNSINVGVSLIDWKIPTPGVVLGSAGTEAFAMGVGLDGGAGNDRITNDGSVVAGGDATAQAVTVSANISGFTDHSLGGGSIPVLGSLSASVSVADTTTRAHADGVGLRGNAGNDTIANNGDITANGTATGGAISASASVNVKFEEGENLFSANAVGARALTLAESTAIGIDGGLANYHQDATDADKASFAADDDVITNAGTINANASTDVLAVSAALVVAGPVKGAGVTLNVAASDTSSLGYATAVGVDGGAGYDQVTNTGTIVANSDVDATSVSAALDVAFAKNGAVVGASLARSVALANATAIGIEGGSGDDTLVNNHRVEAHADADTLAVAVSVALSGTADGVAISGSVADARGEAIATATGMDGGLDNDMVINSSAIDVSDVTASALAAAISVDLAGTNNGVVAGLSIANSSANANANATGLDGGAGNDHVQNSSDITLGNVWAKADAISVSVSMHAALEAGVAAGVAMTDSSTHANVDARGISGGDGDDTILNTGTITANNSVGTEAGAFSAAVSVDVSMAGAALGAALSDSSSNASTRLAGIDGGSGADTISNSGAISLLGSSTVDSTSIGISVTAAAGVGGGLELVNADSEAASTVTGIDGGTGRNTIANNAHLDITSNSSAAALGIGIGVALAVGGDYTVADAQAHATATAIGIGDAGAPAVVGEHGSITNTGLIDIHADADVTGTAISADLRGMSLGETSITALADGYGIHSGDGASLIDNRGTINVTSHAEATGLVVAVSVAGKAVGDADTNADARATGIATGGDDDLVQNAAVMNVDATSHADATAVSVALAGTARTDAQTNAFTTATGFDGGAGNDLLNNTASLVISASSSTSANSLQLTLAGTTGNDVTNGDDVTNAPMSQATAMMGGAGNDVVWLGGADVRVTSNSTADVSSSSWTVGGSGASRAGVEATAAAVAMDGGDGDDQLVQNAGQLRIESTSSVTANSSGWTFFGSSGTEAALTAQARAVGLDGGAGADTLVNQTAFTATAQSSLSADGGGNTVFGNASTSTDIGATATTIGLSGGADNDHIENQANLTLAANSDVNSTRVSFTFAGGADIDELLKSKAVVTGLDGGSGDDEILNIATITANAYARAVTNGSASASLGGGTSASGKAVAEAIATGIDGGSGADVIENRGALAITATIDPVTNNSSSAGVFFGDGNVEGRIEGTINAAGIDAGNGNNQILNLAAITVTTATSLDAVANTYSNGSDFSFGTNGGAGGYSETQIDAGAAGLRAGNGDNTVSNQGAISVHMEGTAARAYTDPNGGKTSGDGNGNTETIANALGQGIQLGDGNSTVVNSDTIDLTVSPTSHGQSDADGTAGDNANSTIDAYSYGEAKGIVAGIGNQHITSTGAIHVTAAPFSTGYADVEGGITDGGATGISNNYSTAKAYGIAVGDGNSTIENHALLSVVAASSAGAFDNDQNVHANGHFEGDANAYIYSQSNSEAYGITAGSGAVSIINTDRIEVSANALAGGGYYVSPGNGTAGHADSSLVTYASGRAVGILLGSGSADINNSGDIVVSALPAVSLAYTDGDGGPYRYAETYGYAVGVDGGQVTGDVTLVNSGNITVRASGSAFASNDGSAFDPTSLRVGGAPTAVGLDLRGSGYKSVVNNGTIDVSADLSSSNIGDFTQTVLAYGLEVSGSGVSVVNNGTISARRTLLGLVGFNGYAMYLSAGTSGVALSLGRSSVTTGDVALYGGKATLELDGNPVLNGNFEYDTSHDFNLVLDNDGSFSHVLPTIANATKNGVGVYNLPTLNTVRGLTLNQGTLSLGGGYTFAPTGLFTVGIHGDGSHGGLAAQGTVNLDGTLHVVGDTDLYSDGTRYRIVAANTLAASSDFDTITLPDATALLSFTTERSASAFDVVAHAASFASVAASGNQATVAASLDTAAQTASGDMRQQLAIIQQLSASDLRRTYDTLSPAAHDLGTGAVLSNFSQYDDALWGRLFDPTFNVGDGAASTSAVARPLEARDSAVRPEFGLWMRGFSRRSTQDASDSFTGYEYKQGGFALGYDHLFGDVTVGVSMGTVSNHVDADDDAGAGHASSKLYSIYSGYSRNGNYIDGVVAYGRNDYDLSRQLVVGATTTQALSDHDGNAISASLNGGTRYEAGGWMFGPFGSLQYIRLREAAFTESGGPLALNIDSRRANSLVSSFGVRLGRPIGYGRGQWMPELDVAWLHDYSSGRSVSASYVGSPDDVFSVAGMPVQRDGAVAGVGVSYRAGGFAARLTYRGEYRDGFSARGLFGGLQYVF